MRFAICPTPRPWWENKKQLHDWVQLAEDLGFDAIFLPDHCMLPIVTNELVDAWVTLSYISAITERIRLGTNVSPLPRYTPSYLAKMISTVDYLSNGRTIVGLGAGAVPEEFINYSLGFDSPSVRVDKFREGVEIMLKLWTEDKVTYDGKYYRLKDAVLYPKPLQKPHPPIWSGCLGDRMLKITAKYFNGWIFPRSVPRAYLPIQEFEKRARAIREYAKKYGRDMRNFTFAVLGSINDDAKIIEEYMHAGCNYYIVELFKGPGLSNPYSSGEYLEVTRKFAKEIMPSFI
ncbi:MAG: LLM class flavin-dependent oxidoreductase [Candidatus Bathyarchaeia archaeon]|nr:LLM class flavin-dependent oxidoreductase [Candidatus Bathyarchaeota archaeon]